MATVNIVPLGGDTNSEGDLKNTNNQSFADSRSNNDGQISLTNPTVESFYFLGGDTDPNRKLGRHFFKADFSVIPQGAVVTGVTFNFNARYGTTGTIETIVLALASQADTLVTGNWAAFSTDFGRYQPSGTGAALQVLTLNAAGIASVSAGATTKFALIGINDFDNTDPGAGNGNAGPIWRTPSDADSAQRPFFTVTYTGGGGNYSFFM